MLAAVVSEPLPGSTGDLAAAERPKRALRSLGRMHVDVFKPKARNASDSSGKD